MSNAGLSRVVVAGPGKPYDLVLTYIVVAAAALFSLGAPHSPLTAVLAFFAVYFAPGYAICSAIFPGRFAAPGRGGPKGHGARVTLLERLVISIILSLFTVAVEGSIIAGAFFGLVVTDLNATTVIVELALTSFFATALALYRRYRLPADEQFQLVLPLPRTRVALSPVEKALGAFLVIGGLVAAGLFAFSLGSVPPEPFTEFALTDTGGGLAGLPSHLNVSESGSLKVDISNQMNREVAYNLTIGLEQQSGFTSFQPIDWANPNSLVNGTALVTSVALGDGHQATQTFIFTISEPGDHKILFVLSDGSSSKTLWLWINVTNPTA
jgi:uncharacterized membrane protein